MSMSQSAGCISPAESIDDNTEPPMSTPKRANSKKRAKNKRPPPGTCQ